MWLFLDEWWGSVPYDDLCVCRNRAQRYSQLSICLLSPKARSDRISLRLLISWTLLFVFEIHWKWEEIELNEYRERRWPGGIIRIMIVLQQSVGQSGDATEQADSSLAQSWNNRETQRDQSKSRECSGKDTSLTGWGGGGGGCRVYSRGTRRHNATGSMLGQQSPWTAGYKWWQAAARLQKTGELLSLAIRGV